MSGHVNRGPVLPASRARTVTTAGTEALPVRCFPTLVVVTFIVGAFSGCTRSPGDSEGSQAPSDPRPAQLVQSTSAVRADDLRCPLPNDDRRVQVLVFTRSDCPISNRYAPRIRELCEVYESRGVEFCVVYPDPRETESSMRAHRAEYGLTCRGLLDADHTLTNATQAQITPEAVVYDRDGRQVYRGRIDDRYVDYGRTRAEPTTDDLRDALEACLHDRPVGAPVTKAIGCLISDLK